MPPLSYVISFQKNNATYAGLLVQGLDNQDEGAGADLADRLRRLIS